MGTTIEYLKMSEEEFALQHEESQGQIRQLQVWDSCDPCGGLGMCDGIQF